MVGKVIAENMVTPMATTNIGSITTTTILPLGRFITITTMRRPDRFMSSITIVRLLWSGTIIRHLFIIQLRRRVDFSSGCQSRMLAQRSALV